MSGEVEQITARVLTHVVGHDADGLVGRSSGFLRVFNPLDWGSLGDGTAIETAIDRLTDNGGGILFVPAALWEVGPDTLVLPSHTRLIGEGRGNTIFKLADGNYLGVAKACVARTGSYVPETAHLVEDVWLFDATFDGNQANVTQGTEMEGINLIGCDWGGVIGCEVKNSEHDGIDCDFSSDLVHERNWIHDCNQNGFHCSTNNVGDIRIVNNLVENCAASRNDQFRAGIDNDTGGGLVAYNTVKNCRTGIRVSGTGGSGVQSRVIGNYVYASTNNEPDIYIGRDGAVVQGNLIAGNEAAGQTQARMELQSSYSIVNGNSIRGYPGIGIKITGDYNSIDGNSMRGFSQAGTTGIQIVSGTGNHIGINPGISSYATPIGDDGTATRAAVTALL